MPSPRQRRGTEAEDRAADFLIQKGMRLIDRHVSSRYGEIDLLMQDGETIVAVEVKARRSNVVGTALEAVTPTKYEKIAQTLYILCDDGNLSAENVRIDLVTVEPSGLQYYRGISPD